MNSGIRFPCLEFYCCRMHIIVLFWHLAEWKKKSARENISGCYADLFCGKYPAWGIPGMPECGGKEWASYFCV